MRFPCKDLSTRVDQIKECIHPRTTRTLHEWGGGQYGIECISKVLRFGKQGLLIR